jgi:hypothetical protein
MTIPLAKLGKDASRAARDFEKSFSDVRRPASRSNSNPHMWRVLNRTPILDRGHVHVSPDLAIPKWYWETLECGCVRLVRLTLSYSPGSVFTRLRSPVSYWTRRPFEPMQSLVPRSRYCADHHRVSVWTSDQATNEQRRRVIALSRRLMVECRRRAKERGLIFP